MRAPGLVLVLVLALAACGAPPAGSRISGDSPEQRSQYDKAPPVTVTYGATTLTLPPWTTCWSSGSSSYCADGAPADEPPDLGTVSEPVAVEFPVDGWEFGAVLRNPEGYCGLWLPVELEPNGEQRWTMPLTGPAGAYEVDLDGRGPEGDVHMTFAMVTTADGPMPEPVARLALVYDVDGVPQLYDPPTLGLTMLPDPGAPISASVDVTSADGRRTHLRLEPAAQECLTVGTAQLSVDGALEAESSSCPRSTSSVRRPTRSPSSSSSAVSRTRPASPIPRTSFRSRSSCRSCSRRPSPPRPLRPTLRSARPDNCRAALVTDGG